MFLSNVSVASNHQLKFQLQGYADLFSCRAGTLTYTLMGKKDGKKVTVNYYFDRSAPKKQSTFQELQAGKINCLNFVQGYLKTNFNLDVAIATQTEITVGRKSIAHGAACQQKQNSKGITLNCKCGQMTEDSNNKCALFLDVAKENKKS